MPSYTITIAPNDDSGTTTTLIVDTSGTEVRITDVHLHADAGLVGGRMPSVDVGLLLQAVNPTADAAKPIEAERTNHRAAAFEAPGPVREVEAHPTPVDASVQDTSAAAPTKRRRAAKPAPAPAQRARARRSATPAASATPTAETAVPAKAKTPAGRKKVAKSVPARKTAAAAASAGKGRVYRRTPDDLAAVYKQAGSATAIAEHYGVPRHTAQGWIQRMRKNSTTTAPAAD
ncbi:hypothetical protein [Couchioplanes caeruleus]|uniref:Uncharacterized protein n=2 Tax=Couchioplanes caeruleus TaxID=56438 RepID=A0A1K0FQ94_9ACTN|nr:hypothetical protein [Couchioplanes caeruleus]OJF14953.1 hypothetical protein BG844_07090 [Couchioplanes caeruleus subsp. caeruleus]ROP30441.1 hypothetical protein EDD30_3292 [Couchioplanes caeruleus]